jgi:hypothetical protein
MMQKSEHNVVTKLALGGCNHEICQYIIIACTLPAGDFYTLLVNLWDNVYKSYRGLLSFLLH